MWQIGRSEGQISSAQVPGCSSLYVQLQDHFGQCFLRDTDGIFDQPWSNFWYPPGTPPSTDSRSGNHYAHLDINLTHPIRTTQLAIAHFLNPKDPDQRAPVSPSNPRSIIHISSVAGQVTPMLAPIYNATKHAINGFVRSLAPLETKLGIRVTAVAPGVIKTPLWTDNPDKLRLVGENVQWVTAEFVAERMIDLVEKDEIQVQSSGSPSTGLSSGDATEEMKIVKVTGGFILEVAGEVRVVEQFNDPGPSSEKNKASQVGIEHSEIFDRLKGGGWGAKS
jgi:3-hydroxybutyrate dehydrogenase